MQGAAETCRHAVQVLVIRVAVFVIDVAGAAVVFIVVVVVMGVGMLVMVVVPMAVTAAIRRALLLPGVFPPRAPTAAEIHGVHPAVGPRRQVRPDLALGAAHAVLEHVRGVHFSAGGPRLPDAVAECVRGAPDELEGVRGAGARAGDHVLGLVGVLAHDDEAVGGQRGYSSRHTRGQDKTRMGRSDVRNRPMRTEKKYIPDYPHDCDAM